MSAETAPDHPHCAPRVVLNGGRAELSPPGAARPGAVPARFSVLSPGTEHRRMLQSSIGPPRGAGYMSLGFGSDGDWMLAPVPHGASFMPGQPGILASVSGTPIQVVALARFQQMAVLGLDRLPAGAELDGAVVLGSGPVAVGCALELCRRGVRRIRVRTSRPQAPIGRVPGAHIETTPGNEKACLVIDAAGVPERAMAILAPGGALGLLGTPQAASSVPALAAHRGGWTVASMHELTGHRSPRYQEAYTTAATWLVDNMPAQLVASWCRTVPGCRAPQILTSLGEPQRRLPEPVIIFDWGSGD